MTIKNRLTFAAAVALFCTPLLPATVGLIGHYVEETPPPAITVPYCEYEDGSSQDGTCYRFDGGANGIGVDYVIVDGRTFYAEDGE